MKKIISATVALLLVVPAASFAEQGGKSPKADEVQKKFLELQSKIHAFKSASSSNSGPGSASSTDSKLHGVENAMQHIRATLERLNEKGINPPGLTNALNRLQCIALKRNLKRGHQGDDVRELQKKLIDDGDLETDNDTGFFGPKTEKALQKWQAKHGIVSSGAADSTGFGSVGPRTRARLSECFMKPPKGENGTTTPPTADTTAPIVSSLNVSSIASTSANVSWTTNENATGKVYFGTSTPITFGSESSVSTVSGMSHTANLTGLMASTTYYYAIQAKDAANNTATTSTNSFLTL